MFTKQRFSDNILLTVEGNIKLTDFGFSLHVLEDNHEIQLSQTWCGTRPYLSPQIVNKTPYNPFKADCWALGVVLYIQLSNKYPFHFSDRKVMLEEQKDKLYIVNK